MVITTILFDFGGVFTPSPFATIRAGGKLLGHDPDEVADVIFGPYDRDTDHPWHRLERGEIAFAECHTQLIAHSRERGMDFDPFEALKSMSGGARGEEPFVARGIALRDEGYRTGLVTNNVREFSDAWRSLIPVDELFEVVVDSCQVGMRKPDPRIFHLALELLDHADPSETVFIDDFEGNIVAAEQLGMRGILVGDDRAAAVRELDALLVRDARPSQ